MKKVQVWAQVTDEHFRAYQREASRRGERVETLVEQTVNCLLRELEHEEELGCREESPTQMS